ncbi:MAG: 4Fe-4S binding protein [Anaerolineae bacterium]|nr:4Fe-4S binding protein [Anaerolineae bacterium]
MKLMSMLGDVVGSLFKKPFTEQYPFEKKPAPESLRGKLTWDASKCSGCMLCVKDCPANAIELITIDKANKRFVMKYHMDRCTFCDQCVVNCRLKCLDLSNEQWELAALSHEPLTVYYGRDEDIQFLLEKSARPGAEAEAPCA